LVNQDQTLLTTVVSFDPMHAYFDMDEPTLLRIRRLINEGRIKRPPPRWWEAEPVPRWWIPPPLPDPVGLLGFSVQMGLQGEDGFPHVGKIDFVNNQVNPTTGSISVRGRFRNPLPDGGVRLLSPGMFVRIRLPLGEEHPALLVIDRAIS